MPDSHKEGGHSTKGTSSLLKDRRYIPCTCYVTLREGDLFLVNIPVSSLWHRRLGHLSKAVITHLSRAGYIPKLSFSDHQFCEHCQYGKQVAASHPTSTSRESSPLDLVHSDVCGPMPHQSFGGASYFAASLTTQLERCGLTLFRPKISCSRSSPTGSQWSKTSLVER